MGPGIKVGIKDGDQPQYQLHVVGLLLSLSYKLSLHMAIAIVSMHAYSYTSAEMVWLLY